MLDILIVPQIVVNRGGFSQAHVLSLTLWKSTKEDNLPIPRGRVIGQECGLRVAGREARGSRLYTMYHPQVLSARVLRPHRESVRIDQYLVVECPMST